MMYSESITVNMSPLCMEAFTYMTVYLYVVYCYLSSVSALYTQGSVVVMGLATHDDGGGET